MASPEKRAKPKAPAKTKKGGRKAPAPRASKAPEEKQSYTKGVSCGRGKHKWVDKGTYFKCEGGENPLCRSTKTKHPDKRPAAKKPETGATQPPSLEEAR